jgi:radical SAM superfamily enzyme YgiQ (UPF0313 family)
METNLPKIVILPLMGKPHSGNKNEIDSRPPYKKKKDTKYNLVPKRTRKIMNEEWKALREAQRLDKELKKICGN